MNIVIRNAEGPIYEQISQQLKAQILSGALPPGSALPSIRALAKDLRISVITTKRAYDELEREGYLYTMPGKGCFVAQPDLELVREEYLKAIEGHLSEARRLARQLNMSDGELTAMLSLLKEEEP
ncbi:MAG TPA: GntR family transcriptional regulator [Candidatus Excrementavichristensenella intestinipullorum]|nr:GntR family transcriptional regulator [Candidatus Excrementavichristensenella intestinipullorum]